MVRSTVSCVPPASNQGCCRRCRTWPIPVAMCRPPHALRCSIPGGSNSSHPASPMPDSAAIICLARPQTRLTILLGTGDWIGNTIALAGG